MKQALEKLLGGHDLTEGEAAALLDDLADEGANPVLSGAVLTALRAKGESPDEIRGFATRLQDLAIRPNLPDQLDAVDVVGTGGDGSGSLNLSTGAALLAAAAGVPVVKHGNRSISSDSGSADVLAALGLDLPFDPSRAGEVFRATGFTFLFAPAYHPAMKSIAPVRAQLATRTIFNIAGPLANPASPRYGVVGAYSPELARIMAATLAGMPIERAFVVHGEPGWDEATPVGPYLLLEVAGGRVVETFEDPADLGFPRVSPADLAGSDPAYNAARIRDVFAGEQGPHREALVLGASLALRIRGHQPAEAIEMAALAIDDGQAMALVESLDERVHV